MNPVRNRMDSKNRPERTAPLSTGLLILAALVGGVLLGRFGPHKVATAQGAPNAAVVVASTAPIVEPGPAPETPDPGCGCAEACLVRTP